MPRTVDRLHDLVPEILSRLPVKSLMRFKCVQKSWLHLIQHPTFVSKHLHNHSFNQNQNGNTNTLLVNRTRPATFGPSGVNRKAFVSLLSFDEETNSSSLNLLDLLCNLGEVTRVEILGPCNGIYCLYSHPTLLINPAIRESRVLPQSHDPPGTISMRRYPGFGFDPKTSDYKVVFVMDLWDQNTEEQLPWHAVMYTLSSNCWRDVDCPVPSVSIWAESWIDAFVHGAFHWWAYDDAGDAVLAFDMVDEMFRTIRFPDVLSSELETGAVAKFGESLAVIVYPFMGSEKYFDLWVMEDYGNDGSWTKRFTIGPIAGAERPMGFWKSDQFVVEDSNGGMVLYDLQTQEIRNTGFHGEGGSLQAAVYMESMVSLRRDSDQSQGVSFFNIVPDTLFDEHSG